MSTLVAKPFTPNLNIINRYLERVHASGWLTNNGPLARELTTRLEDYLGVSNLVLTANGTLALQVAYRALHIEDTAITTPFTFSATASAMKWQGLQPWFVDIDPGSLCLSPQAVERAIQSFWQARESMNLSLHGIVPVHVYGNPCDVEAFSGLSKEHKLPVVYDASHAFGIQYKGKNILNWGDASTLSFHATKLFHTVEGGAVIFNDGDAYEAAKKMVNFGLEGSDISGFGLNAKMSEVHAAYGLANLDCVDQILERRLEILNQYKGILSGVIDFPKWNKLASENASYVPILLRNESHCHAVLQSLECIDVKARRYFYPSLHMATEFSCDRSDKCSNAEDVAPRVLCLPVYPGLEDTQVQRICEAVKRGIG